MARPALLWLQWLGQVSAGLVMRLTSVRAVAPHSFCSIAALLSPPA